VSGAELDSDRALLVELQAAYPGWHIWRSKPLPGGDCAWYASRRHELYETDGYRTLDSSTLQGLAERLERYSEERLRARDSEPDLLAQVMRARLARVLLDRLEDEP
jgi:hypothetical protein